MSKNTNNTAALFVVHNGKQVDLSDIKATPFDAICNQMIEATENTYGSHIRLAAKLNDMLPFAWFDVTPEDLKSKATDEAKAMEPHWTALYAALRKAGHTNPSVPGGRIRDYGRNIRAGLAPNGKTMADGSALPNNVSPDGEGEGANPAKRSPMLRNVEEAIALWKFNSKLPADQVPAQLTAAIPHLAAFLKALGVDVRTIK